MLVTSIDIGFDNDLQEAAAAARGQDLNFASSTFGHHARLLVVSGHHGGGIRNDLEREGRERRGAIDMDTLAMERYTGCSHNDSATKYLNGFVVALTLRSVCVRATKTRPNKKCYHVISP